MATLTSYPEVQAKLEEIFYAIGLSPPKYPVPAIRHEFEFGWQLGKGVVLIHSTYSSYDG